MNKYNAIKLLDEMFTAQNLKYTIHETEKYQEIDVPFGILNGPSVIIRFVSFNRDNDIMITIPCLVNNIPAEKHSNLLKTLNEMNEEYRFIKFVLNSENNIDVRYDLPVNTGDESLGEMGFEIFIRIMKIMNECYQSIAKALYAPSEDMQTQHEEAEEKSGILRILDENHEGINIRISKIEQTEIPEG